MKLISRKDATASSTERYFTNKPCKHGHICERYTKSTNCIICQSEYNKSDKQKINQKIRSKTSESMESQRIKSSKYHKKNRDRILLGMKARNAIYYANNKEKIITATAKYQRENASARTAYKAKWANEKKVGDPQFRSLLLMRKLVARTCDRIKLNRKQIGRTIAVLGYSSDEFKRHIERQFISGMKWGNHGEWHVDHIIPLSKFNLLDAGERLVANGLTNLMPIWAKDNFSKSDSIQTLL